MNAESETSIPVKVHGFVVSLTVFDVQWRSHADLVISNAFLQKQKKMFGFYKMSYNYFRDGRAALVV